MTAPLRGRAFLFARKKSLLKQTDIYIPKALAHYALSNKCVPELRLFVYLKMSCSGKLAIDKAYREKACKDLNISRSTFYRLLNGLKERDWVCYSERSGLYFIIGFRRVLKKEGLKGNTAGYFVADWFDRFKAFLSGLVITYLCKHQKKAERKKGRSNKLSPVASKALALILAIPKSTAYTLKKKAHESDFISKVRDYRSTGISGSYINEFRQTHPEVAHRAVVDNGQIKLCMPDLVSGFVRCKTKRYKSF